MKTIFDMITENLRLIIEKAKVESAEKDELLNVQAKSISKLQQENERLREENNLLHQELEHKAFQDDF